MNRLSSAVLTLIKDESGATMVEYALMLAGIAIICFGAVQLVGTGTKSLLTNAADNYPTSP